LALECGQELVTQAADIGMKIDWIVMATGSTETQAEPSCRAL
jgi:1-aminocyclopropane-1-carboxylate deaminase/D-cysteine desulfhydrase-like pyridoxal-dependent ACC family enzyme